MVDRKLIEEILGVAVNCPSGHNCQPWKFVYKGGVLSLINDPSRDKTLFNHNQKGSYIAHGALLENIAITAAEKGWSANIQLFPEKDNQDLVANISFHSGGKPYKYRYLFPYIWKRTTNRKHYKRIPLTEKDRKEIDKLLQGSDFDGGVLIFTDKPRILLAAQLFSVGDRVLFDNYYLHKALFSVVNWSQAEENARKEGLFVGTKELAAPVRIIFKYLISRWGFIKGFSFMNVPLKMSKKRQVLYSHCSAIGLVMGNDDSPEGFIGAGRKLQRFWLLVTGLGLSFQPISVGLLFLGQWTQWERPEKLTSEQYKYINNAYQEILKLFKPAKKVPAFSFRIGYSSPPTASSLKKEPEISFL